MTSTSSNPQTSDNKSSASSKGFAAMPKKKIQEIASKDGHSSVEKAGSESMAERGHKGAEARKDQLGSMGSKELVKKDDKVHKKNLSGDEDEGEDEEDEEASE